MASPIRFLMLLLVLAGCAARPARDANLVLQRMYTQLRVIEDYHDYPAARALMIKTRDEYRRIIGESPLFDRFTDLALQAIDLDEQKDLAIKSGADPHGAISPWYPKRTAGK